MDALDEFLNLALDYERDESPSLQGFVAWLRAAKSEIKRDMEIARDEVRVMTVHGAKGLEAPVVVLADTATPPHGWHPPRLLSLPVQGAAPDAPAALIWAGRKADDVGPMAAARSLALRDAEHEYRRLLYVAMTRAAEHLIVCGIDGERARPAGCWYDLVCNALQPLCVEEPAEDGAMVRRFRKVASRVQTLSPATSAEHVAPRPLPAWLAGMAAAEPPRASPLSPSRAFDEAAPAEPARSGTDRRRALARGVAVHRLLQALPELPPERRREAALRYLQRPDKDFSETERETMIDQVLAMLAEPRFAPLFSPGSRAEIAIAGRVGLYTVSGQVDRLVVTGDAVLIADYKTNRPAPRNLADAPPAYVGQLALYRAVLARLYPDRTVRAALVWTETMELMEIPGDRLDAALAELVSS
jgi:ATP-dependent helicase/nuclease subunit A